MSFKKTTLNIFLILSLFISHSSLAAGDGIKENLNNIDKKIREAGYNGVNRNYGIARFLYHAMKGEYDLETGLNYAFWTELSENDQRMDNKWKLSQVIDNYEIYKIVDFSGRDLVNLTIAIPATSKMPMEGQVLKDGVYIFTGNVDFVSTIGVPMLVQGFKPVSITYTPQTQPSASKK